MVYDDKEQRHYKLYDATDLLWELEGAATEGDEAEAAQREEDEADSAQEEEAEEEDEDGVIFSFQSDRTDTERTLEDEAAGQ